MPASDTYSSWRCFLRRAFQSASSTARWCDSPSNIGVEAFLCCSLQPPPPADLSWMTAAVQCWVKMKQEVNQSRSEVCNVTSTIKYGCHEGTQCSFVHKYHQVRGIWCLHLQSWTNPEYRNSRFLWNAGAYLSNYMISNPWRPRAHGMNEWKFLFFEE